MVPFYYHYYPIQNIMAAFIFIKVIWTFFFLISLKIVLGLINDPRDPRQLFFVGSFSLKLKILNFCVIRISSQLVRKNRCYWQRRKMYDYAELRKVWLIILTSRRSGLWAKDCSQTLRCLETPKNNFGTIGALTKLFGFAYKSIVIDINWQK